jgi:hypothetical protein
MKGNKFINEFQEILNSASIVEQTVLQLNTSPDDTKLVDDLLPEASHTVVLVRGLFDKINFETDE